MMLARTNSNIKTRNSSIDATRIITTFGVVAIHVHSNTSAAENISLFFLPLSVPFFYIVALSYYIANLRSISASQTLFKTLHRLVIPYLVWTCIYVFLLVVKHEMSHQQQEMELWRILFYGESAVQLYFLPQLMIMQLTALAGFIFISSISIIRFTSLILLLACIVYFVWGYEHNCFGVTRPLSVASYLLSGLCFSTVIHIAKPRLDYVLIGAALVIISLSTRWIKYDRAIVDYMVRLPIGGIGLLLVSLSLPRANWPIWMINLSSATFGIYLSHVLFLEAFEFVVEKIDLNINYDFITKLIVVSVVFSLSIFFTFIVRQVPLLKSILLGEK